MNWVLIILAITAFVSVLRWDVTDDVSKWKKGIPVKHGKELIPRILLLLIPGILFSIVALPSWWAILVIPFMMGSWWWEFFDGFYNKERGFTWRFNGSVDADDAKLDKLLRHFSPVMQGVIKWFLITGFTTLFVILSK